jgi:hypothetical protein
VAILDADWYDVRRKFGGACCAPYRGNPVVRLKPSPCDPMTSKQCLARNRWAHAHWIWANELSDQQREEWQERVTARWWYDGQDQYRPLSGVAAFVALASRALLIDGEVVYDKDEEWWGEPLETLEVTLVDETTIEVDYTPTPWLFHKVVVFARGPMRVGAEAILPTVNWGSDKTPRLFKFVGYTEPEEAGPVEMTLPFRVRAGEKAAVIAQQWSLCGGIDSDWELVEVEGT